MDDKIYSRDWYNKNSGVWETIEYKNQAWNPSKYLDHTDNPEYGQLIDGKHYYHLPAEESYQSDNELYGYQYGEETLHYMIIEINENSCTISSHYPNGDLMTGPAGVLPQRWEFNK